MALRLFAYRISLKSADTQQSPHSDSKFITMCNPVVDAYGC